jgi:hypothetical protein
MLLLTVSGTVVNGHGCKQGGTWGIKNTTVKRVSNSLAIHPSLRFHPCGPC